MECGWMYYNHAYLPDGGPQDTPDLQSLKDGSIWKTSKNKALMARWTTDFDCGYDTGWWYCIKDSKFDINSVKAKIRYYIKKGVDTFDVRVIDPVAYQEEIFDCAIKAFSVYPAAYRPTLNKDSFIKELYDWKNGQYVVFGAFEKENGTLQGYALCHERDCCVDFNVQKTNPAYEKLQVNAALVYGICEYYNERLSKDFYICDGARNIMYETNFQSYFEKYFDFRKAYCVLHLKYRKGVNFLVKLIFPFRKVIAKINNGLCKRISGVLKMEEIMRKSKEKARLVSKVALTEGKE